MTTIFLQNKKRRKTRFFIFAILIILGISNGDARTAAVNVVSLLTKPLIEAIGLATDKKDNIFGLFKNKQVLTAELNSLKEKNIVLENKIALMEVSRKENENLKLLLAQSNKKSYIFGSVILRPPQSPYDVVVVDAGLDNGVIFGMRVISHSSVLIGNVAEALPGMSKIKLISFPKEETNLIIEGANVSAVGIGTGGGNIEIKIPHSVKVSEGDKIITDGTFPYLIGKVEKIETNPLDPFQKILFRIPVNLNETRGVGIEK